MSGQHGSPFSPATAAERRLKLFSCGDSGTGKTTLALRFPSVILLDMEDEAAHHDAAFPFDMFLAAIEDEDMPAVDGPPDRPKRKEPA